MGYDAGIADSVCPVCSQYMRQKIGGRPVRIPSVGRLKKKRSDTPDISLSSDSSPVEETSSGSAAVEQISSTLHHQRSSEMTPTDIKTDMESVHCERLHAERLHLLCRVCGGCSKRFKESSVKSCELVATELMAFYGIDITQDKTNYHSQTLCTKCYTQLFALKNAEKPSLATLQRAKAQIDSAENLWVAYDAGIADSVCPVCTQYLHQKKAGTPVRNHDWGKPKKKRSDTSDISFSSDSSPVEETPSGSAAVEQISSTLHHQHSSEMTSTDIKTEVESVHCEKLHVEQLYLCRVCGGNSKTFVESSVKPCDLLATELMALHGIDVTQDRTNYHSQTLCSECYHQLMALKHADKPSLVTLQKAKVETDSAENLWVGCDADLANSVCSGESQYVIRREEEDLCENMSGGRPKKKKSDTSDISFSSDSTPVEETSSGSAAVAQISSTLHHQHSSEMTSIDIKTEMESVHCEKPHVEQLYLLCRVCGGLSETFVESSVKPCELLATELMAFHGIDVTQDRTNYHSQTLCSECYHQLMALKHADNPSLVTLQKAKIETDSAENLWMGYDADLANSVCSGESQYVCQKRGERPLLKWDGGRPKKRKSDTPDISFSSDSTPVEEIPSGSAAVEHISSTLHHQHSSETTPTDIKTDMESVHCERLHAERLHLLCRVCGGRSKRQTESSAKSCELVAAELMAFHGIDITQDKTNYHSQTLCTKCYNRLLNLKRYADNLSLVTLQRAKAQIDSAENLWAGYDAGIADSVCPVCSQYVRQKTGGRPVRNLSGRRLKKKRSDTPDISFSSDSTPVEETSSGSAAVEQISSTLHHQHSSEMTSTDMAQTTLAPLKETKHEPATDLNTSPVLQKRLSPAKTDITTPETSSTASEFVDAAVKLEDSSHSFHFSTINVHWQTSTGFEFR